jgi:site-specific DNA-cytosine methylase
MSFTHASIIPLIGGMTLAQHHDSGSMPEYLMTYSGFQDNESHLLNHYNSVYNTELPYYFIDKGDRPARSVDVVNTTCPCAGLSQLSHAFGADNKNNQWMIKTAEYVLGEHKPQVFWGENAPGFAGKIGAPIREKMFKIGRDNGYVMSVYRTKSLLHGTPQVRERSFYFFWKGNRIPLLNYYNTPWIRIEDMIRSVTSNTLNEPISKKKPSEDPYYKFILEQIYGGITHREFSNNILKKMNVRSNDAFSYIEQQRYDYKQLGEWMVKNNFEREAAKCEYKYNKLAEGKNIMRRGTIVPHDYIGAFVGFYTTSLTHPDEDRYITYREALTIMGLPQNFELLNPAKSSNHICQNVPYGTAKDMAFEVRAVLDGQREYVDAEMLYQFNNTRSHKIMSNAPGAQLEEFLN